MATMKETAEEMFLPSDYSVPQSGGHYLKLKEGDTRFRFLARPIIGYEAWITEGDKRKPERTTMDKPFPVTITEKINPDDGVKHFWAMPVWDYDSNDIKILEITQKSVMKELARYIKDPDWGTPLKYDFVIGKTGEGKETRYSVITKPHKELPAEVQKMWAELQPNFNIDLLFVGGDPWDNSDKTVAEVRKLVAEADEEAEAAAESEDQPPF